MDFEKMIWDMANFNISIIKKEDEAKQKNRCPYCGGKMREALFIDHENDETLWEDICSNNCKAEGDFDRN